MALGGPVAGGAARPQQLAPSPSWWRLGCLVVAIAAIVALALCTSSSSSSLPDTPAAAPAAVGPRGESAGPPPGVTPPATAPPKEPDDAARSVAAIPDHAADATAHPRRRPRRRWVGVECDFLDLTVDPMPSPSTAPEDRRAHIRHVWGVDWPHPLDPALCFGRDATAVAGNASLRCTFWNRAVFSAPRTPAMLHAALARTAERKASLGRCTAAQLQRDAVVESALSDDAMPLTPTGHLRFVADDDNDNDDGGGGGGPARSTFRPVIDGCKLDRNLLDDPHVLLATLWSLADRGRRPIVFSGDSVMRQLAARFVYALRGAMYDDRSPPPPVFIEHASGTSWGDWVFVVRRLDDEFRVVNPAATHFPAEAQKHAFPNRTGVAGAPRSECWDVELEGGSAAAATRVEPTPPREPVLSMLDEGDAALPPRNVVRQCIRGGDDETVGAAWCDPDDAVNPCLLRLEFVWSNHEGFVREDDYARGRRFTYRQRPAAAYGHRSNATSTASADNCLVDCASRTRPPTAQAMPWRRHDSGSIINKAAIRAAPMALRYRDVPAFHVLSNLFWAPQFGFGGGGAARKSAGEVRAYLTFAQRITSHFVGRFWSWAMRLWRSDLCLDQPADAADCEKTQPPPYRALWLTAPRMRGAAKQRGNAMVPWRNRRMKRAVAEDWNPRVHAEQVAAGSLDPTTHPTLDGWLDDPAHFPPGAAMPGGGKNPAATPGGRDPDMLPQPPQRPFVSILDVGGLAETLPANVTGIDVVHWMCQQTRPQLRPCDLRTDSTGRCVDDINGGFALLVASMALELATSTEEGKPGG